MERVASSRYPAHDQQASYENPFSCHSQRESPDLDCTRDHKLRTSPTHLIFRPAVYACANISLSNETKLTQHLALFSMNSGSDTSSHGGTTSTTDGADPAFSRPSSLPGYLPWEQDIQMVSMLIDKKVCRGFYISGVRTFLESIASPSL